MALGEGMNISVGLSMALTGFEMLSQIATQLETLQGLAARTEAAFNQMGAAFARSMTTGTAEAMRAVGMMERVSRTTGQRSFVPETIIPPGGLAGIQAMQGLRQQRMAEEGVRPDPRLPDAQRRHILAINDEIGARGRMISSLRAGIMGGLGVTAAFEVANLTRRAMRAVGELDERMAALRLGGYTPQQIAAQRQVAIEAFVPGANVAEKISGAQQIGNIIGPQNVTADMMRQIQVATNAIMLATGRQDRPEVMQQFLRIVQSRGAVTSENMLRTLQDIEMSGKDVNLEAIKNSTQQGQTFFRALDINNNPGLRALNTTLNERFGGRGGLYLNEVFTQFYSNLGKIGSGMGGHGNALQQLLMSQGLLDFSHLSMYPALGPQGGIHPTMRITGPALRGVDQQNIGQVFGTILQAIERDFTRRMGRRPNELERVQQYGRFFPPEVARTLAVISADDFIKEYKSMLERQTLVPQTWADQEKAAQNFRLALNQVGAEFDSLVSTFAEIGGITNALSSFAHSLHSLTVFLSQHPGIGQTAGAVGMGGLIAGGVGLGAMALRRLLGFTPAIEAAAPGLGAAAGEGAALGAGAAAGQGMLQFFGRNGLLLSGAARFTAELLAAAPGLAALGLAAYAANRGLESFSDWVAKLLGRTPEHQRELDEMDKRGKEEMLGFLRRLWEGPFAWTQRTPEATQSMVSHMEAERRFQGAYGPQGPEKPAEPPAQQQPPQQQRRQPQANVPRPMRFAPTREQITLPQGAGPRPGRADVNAMAARQPAFGGMIPAQPPAPMARPMPMQPFSPLAPQMVPPAAPLLARPPTPMQPPGLVQPPTSPMTPQMVPPAAPPLARPPTPPMPERQATPNLSSINTGTIVTGSLIVRGAGPQQAQPAILQGGGFGALGAPRIQQAAFTRPLGGETPRGLQRAEQPMGIEEQAKPWIQRGMPKPTEDMPRLYPQPPSPYHMQGAYSSWLREARDTTPATTFAMRGHRIERVPGVAAPQVPSVGAPQAGPQALPSLPGDQERATLFPSGPDLQTYGGIGTTRYHGPGGAAAIQNVPHGGGRMGESRMPLGLRGSAPATPLTSEQQKKAAGESLAFWMSKGLTRQQAAGMVAQESAESRFNPRAVGDSGLATGLYQWHPDRVQNILAGTGIDVRTATPQQQREAAFWELQHTEKAAWQRLTGAGTEREAGFAATSFERPAGGAMEAERRAGLAAGILKSIPDVQGPQLAAEQADVPASQLHVTINSNHYMDGEQVASNVAQHFIGGGPTASSSGSIYDSKMMPWVPGSSAPRF